MKFQIQKSITKEKEKEIKMKRRIKMQKDEIKGQNFQK
jgi:hypothetical protein